MTREQQQQVYRYQQQRRQILLRNFVLNRNIEIVSHCINAGNNPLQDPEISKIYYALIGEFGEGFFGPENSPAMLLLREDDEN